MAEVLGIIAAVVGVADVGYKLSISLYRYSHAVASPGKAIESISSEVSLLASVLQQLGSCLEEDEFVKLCKAETLTTTKDIAEECKAAFGDLDVIIGKYVEGGRMKLKDRLKWPFVEKRITLVRVNLDRLKSSLMLMLEVLRYARSIVRHEQNRSGVDREIIVALQQANVDATRRYETLLLAIEDSSTTKSEPFAQAAADMNVLNLQAETEGSTSASAYVIVDENGVDLTQTNRWLGKEELLNKLKRVSALIDQVDRAQADIMELTQHNGIWEMSLAHGGPDGPEAHHFRYTSISQHDRLPESSPSDGGINGVPPFPSRQSTHTYQPKVKEVYIAVMGVTGVGKSTFVNLLCGKGTAAVSHSLQRGTEIIYQYDFMYNTGVRVHLIDTPGFDDTGKTETEVLKDLLRFLHELQIDKIKLSGILCLHNLASSRAHHQWLKNLQLLKQLLGGNPFSRVVLVMTKADVIGETKAKEQENLLQNDRTWRYMAEQGSRLLLHTGDKQSAMRIIKSILQLPKVMLDTQQEMASGRAKPNDTQAGNNIEGALRDEQHRLEQQLKEIREEFNAVLDTHDRKLPEELRRAQERSGRANLSPQAVAKIKLLHEQQKHEMMQQMEAEYKAHEESLRQLNLRLSNIRPLDAELGTPVMMEYTINGLLNEYTTIVDTITPIAPEKPLHLESREATRS